MARITILGMGAMGSRMAAALLRAGHEVTVWNRNPDKTVPLVAVGAISATSPRSAVATADFAISMVRDDEASRQVWLDQHTGALAGLRASAIAIESSTVTVAWVRELYANCCAYGIAFLDAPVAGSRPQAEAAQLIYFVGGEAAVVAQADPILKAMGSTVHHAGPASSGAAIKLVVNALLAASAMLARNFVPMFPIKLAEKDLGYILEGAAENNARMPMVQATASAFTEAAEHGYGGDNITGLVQLYSD